MPTTPTRLGVTTCLALLPVAFAARAVLTGPTTRPTADPVADPIGHPVKATPSAKSTSPAPPQTAALADGVTVLATGKATIQGDRARVRFKVSGGAPTIDDAHTQFIDRRTLFLKAMQDFKDVHVALEPDGVRIGRQETDLNMMVFDGSEAPAGFEASEVYAVTIDQAGDDVANIVSLIESATDADCALAMPPALNPYTAFADAAKDEADEPPKTIEFTASKEAIDAAQAQAIKAALTDARSQAEMIAAAADRTLGPVQAVEVDRPFERAADLAGATSREVRLRVRFSLR